MAVVAWTLAVGTAAPLLVLVVRAAADVWRAPALWPQQLGLRALRLLAADAGGIAAAVGNSLLVAVLTTAVALLLGWPAARVLGRSRAGPWVLLLALPVLVPQHAVGTGLAEWLLRLGLADSIPGLVLAHLVQVLPYVVLLLAPGFGPQVTALEEAGRVHGLHGWRLLRSVTVPAVRPALAAATLLGFLVSWSQYGTSLAVGGGLPMLPLLLLPFVGADPQVAAMLALLFLLPALAALGVAVAAARPEPRGSSPR